MITNSEMIQIELLYDLYRSKFNRGSICCHKEMYAIIHKPLVGDEDPISLMLSRVGTPAPRVDKNKYPTFEELPV